MFFGKPKCEFCKNEIMGEAYEKDGKKFHSKECADNFRRATSKGSGCCR